MNGVSPSARQLQVLRAIQRHHELKGFPISMRELGDELGIKSTNGVSDHLKALVRLGLVSRARQKSRTLRLTDLGRREIQHG